MISRRVVYIEPADIARVVRDAKFNLRLPGDLMVTLRRCARENERSLNAEIIWRLRRSLDGYRI